MLPWLLVLPGFSFGSLSSLGNQFMPTPPSIRLVTLGCAKNSVDSQVLSAKLQRAGFLVAAHLGNADFVIVNTCGFIEAAKQESINAILDEAQREKGFPPPRLLVMGCLSQRYRSDLRESLPEVEEFFGVDEPDRIVVFLLKAAGLPAQGPPKPQRDLPDAPPPRLLPPGRTSGYLKISEGCNHRCTFCAIPAIRGQHRSRSLESLVAEADFLARQGVKELSMISQDTAYYGADLGLRQGLAKLLQRLGEVEGIEWLRLHYVYPSAISDSLLRQFKRNPKLVPYLDIPIQHVSDPLLRAMRRPDTRNSLRRIVGRLRQTVPDISLRTTVLVGFPGETEGHFQELLDFLDECRFDHLGVFTYSDEDGTPAARLPDKIEPEVANERQEILLSLQREISRERLQRFVGRTMKILAEEQTSEGVLVGRTAHQAKEVDGLTYISGNVKPGEFVELSILRSLDYDLVASGEVNGSLIPVDTLI